MASHIVAFIAGGYLAPAVLFGWLVWRAEGYADDSPTTLERATSALMNGLGWPFGAVRAEPAKQ